MVNKILGVFLLWASGLIYTIERVVAQYVWVSQVTGDVGSYPANPEFPGIMTNIYVLVFAVLGAVLLVAGFFQKGK